MSSSSECKFGGQAAQATRHRADTGGTKLAPQLLTSYQLGRILVSSSSPQLGRVLVSWLAPQQLPAHQRTCQPAQELECWDLSVKKAHAPIFAQDLCGWNDTNLLSLFS